jgi:hypothetical protein
MKHLLQIFLAALWILLAMPLGAQVAGFAGADNDRDGLPDDFEQAILEKFRPTWNISTNDCDMLPAEFMPDAADPTVKARNGTIYGQVFIRGASTLGFFIEAHFYDLWAADCGYINSHLLDAEHVSVLIRVSEPAQPLSEWHASQWYAGAHEDTICDASQFASAAIIHSEDKGATIWIARGKHGAFFSQEVCRLGGCGLDRCEASMVSISPSPINIGEANAPLNGAVWVRSDRWPLLVKLRTDFPTFSTFSSLSYSVPDRGTVSFSTTGSPVDTGTGYAFIESSAGDTAPSGVAIFSIRRNNVLVAEAAVPNSAPIGSGRIHAEVHGQVNTGLGIVNPNSQSAQISFFFTDSNGRDFGNNTISVPANDLLGRFVNESPFNSGSFGTGTFTFNSSLPISVVALRGFTNERGEFLITTLPVSPLKPAVGETLVFPHLADGGGWATEFALVNPTDDVISGTIEFLGQGTATSPADPLELIINGQSRSTLPYTIAPRSSWVATTTGSTPVTRVGSVRITPDLSNSAPSGLEIFSFRRAGIVVTQSGIAASSSGSAFRLFVESSGSFKSAEPRSLQTGIAIANLADTAASLNWELTGDNGNSVGTGQITVPARGQVALFLDQLPGLATLPTEFQGGLRISTTSSGAISVVGLRGRYNERRDFLIATTPAVNESAASTEAETLFPYLAEGGGYATQFILSSPAVGRASSGWVRFYTPSGIPLNLSLK